MKDKGSSIINFIFFPFRLVQTIFGFGNNQIKFINSQRTIENNYKAQRDSFIRLKKKTYRSNDEIA